MSITPQRGQVYRCDLGYGLKPWLVVSNNSRNRLLDDVIAIRLTITVRDLPTRVKLAEALCEIVHKASPRKRRESRCPWGSLGPHAKAGVQRVGKASYDTTAAARLWQVSAPDPHASNRIGPLAGVRR